MGMGGRAESRVDGVLKGENFGMYVFTTLAFYFYFLPT
jgi:hypothetical protein